MLGSVCQLLMSGMCWGAMASTHGIWNWVTSFSGLPMGKKCIVPLSYRHILDYTGFSLQRGLEYLVILLPQHP